MISLIVVNQVSHVIIFDQMNSNFSKVIEYKLLEHTDVYQARNKAIQLVSLEHPSLLIMFNIFKKIKHLPSLKMTFQWLENLVNTKSVFLFHLHSPHNHSWWQNLSRKRTSSWRSCNGGWSGTCWMGSRWRGTRRARGIAAVKVGWSWDEREKFCLNQTESRNGFLRPWCWCLTSRPASHQCPRPRVYGPHPVAEWCIPAWKVASRSTP